MNHSCSQQLYPFIFFAELELCIYFKSWFDKRKIGRSHSDLDACLFEKSLEDISHHGFEMCNTDMFVDDHSF